MNTAATVPQIAMTPKAAAAAFLAVALPAISAARWADTVAEREEVVA